VGFEALLRWRHPQRGDVPPSVFVPMAEEAGLIGPLGLWVLGEACRTATQWPRQLRVAVNVSPMQFDDPEFAAQVRAILARHQLAPDRLELELTEGLFLDDRPQTAMMLHELRTLGVGFSIDDFGTGYSSLGYLSKMAFQRLKIDRSFVSASVAQGGQSVAIIQAIVALADRLGLETVAEGTETRAEFEAMRRLGCAQAQGYYFGRPMSAEDVRRLLDRQRPLLAIEPAFNPPPSDATASGQSPAGAALTSPPARPAPREPHPA
jgi:EAL domain-containing protein (putative c-di-GMP-specific phosphodiesterase class I)